MRQGKQRGEVEGAERSAVDEAFCMEGPGRQWKSESGKGSNKEKIREPSAGWAMKPSEGRGRAVKGPGEAGAEGRRRGSERHQWRVDEHIRRVKQHGDEILGKGCP